MQVRESTNPVRGGQIFFQCEGPTRRDSSAGQPFVAVDGAAEAHASQRLGHHHMRLRELAVSSRCFAKRLERQGQIPGFLPAQEVKAAFPGSSRLGVAWRFHPLQFHRLQFHRMWHEFGLVCRVPARLGGPEEQRRSDRSHGDERGCRHDTESPPELGRSRGDPIVFLEAHLADQTVAEPWERLDQAGRFRGVAKGRP